MVLTDSDYQEIEALAAANYTVKNIALYLDAPVRAFRSEWENPDSLVRCAYDRGVLMSEGKIDTSLTALAEKGNLTAIQILDKHRRANLVDQIKKSILYAE